MGHFSCRASNPLKRRSLFEQVKQQRYTRLKERLNRVHFKTHTHSFLDNYFRLKIQGKGKREKMNYLKLQFSCHGRGLEVKDERFGRINTP